MLLDFFLITTFGFISYTLFEKIKMPGLLGLLGVGMVLGPYGLDWLSQELISISSDIRMIALIIILLRAGLGLSRSALKEVGNSASKLSVLPLLFEGFAWIGLAVWALDFSLISGGLIGFIIAAVSPAVIVPSMLLLKEKLPEDKKKIPNLVLLSASVDDVIAITFFSVFLNAALQQNVSWLNALFQIPLGIVLGLILGLGLGYLLVLVFRKFRIRDSQKVFILLSAALLLVLIEDWFTWIPIASLIGVMMIGVTLVDRRTEVAERLALKYEKIWLFARLFLFVLVGATVNITLGLSVFWMGTGLIALGLVARTFGVFLSLLKSSFNLKEKTFIAISMTPKATVQAAIGSIPLSLGLPHGELILALSVLSILITAPLGALAIRWGQQRFLDIKKPVH